MGCAMSDSKLLLMAAEHSKRAYDDARQTINGTGISYSFGGGILHISYSGTQNSDDVLTDLSILPNFRGCHRGFYNRAKALLIPTINIINTYANGRDVQIILCGHSLGGAIAQIMCKLLKGRFKYLKVITFGSPKVWLKWANPKIEHIRVEHVDDPVPKLLPFLYRHYQVQTNEIGNDKFLINVDSHKIETYIGILEQ